MARQVRRTAKQFLVIDDSQQDIPKWLSDNIAGKKRVWGVVIVNYPLKFIVPAIVNNHNPRLDPTLGIEHLNDNIEAYGFVGTLTVTPIGKDRTTGMIQYEIIGGDRRYFVLKQRKIDYVNIQVYEGSEKEIAPLRLALNSEPELHPVDEAIYMHDVLVTKYGYTHEQISKRCSTSSRHIGRTWVTTLCNIVDNVIPEVLTAWKDGSIRKTHALHIARTFNREDRAEQLKALELCGNGIKVNSLNSKKLRKMVKSESNILCDKPKKKNKTIEKPTMIISKPQPKFNLFARYRELNTNRGSDRLIDMLLKEYEWILGIRRDKK